MDRRGFIKSGIAVATPLLLSGCLTRASGVAGQPSSGYTEIIDSVLISQDLMNLVAVGKEYDYVFGDARRLSKLIKSDIHLHLSAEFGGFAVQRGNLVNGTLVLGLNTIDAVAVEAASELGFGSSESGGLHLRFPLRGTRYRKNPNVVVGESYKLNRSYSVPVALPAGVDPGELLLTPLKIAAGGALVLIAIPVIALSLISGQDLK